MEQGKLGRLESAADNQSQKIKTYRRRRLQTPHLPAEIIYDILLRLPVKSLSRSKCVSKSWLSLISSPQFVKSHLKLSAENADFANHRVILTTPGHVQLVQCSVSSLMSQPQIAASELDYPWRSSVTAHLVVGCCNGIVCIAIDDNYLCLLNPSTGKTKELPSASVEMEPGFISQWGFGYTESDDDYKVVGIFDAYDDGEVLEVSMVKVYSLRTNSWKRVDYLSCGTPIKSNGKFANGKLHFSSTNRHIVSFDLNNCNWDIAKWPNYGEECSHYSTLGLLGGCLTFLCDDYERQLVDLWVMKESWTRLVSIPYFDHMPCFHPLMIMSNGEFLVLFNMKLIVYNPKKNSLRRVRVQTGNDIVNYILEADIYCESLVPL